MSKDASQSSAEARKRWEGQGNPTSLWLDCDPGHDDAFAMLLSAQCPSLKLLGISTVYGNAPLTRTTKNARSILRAIDREDIPIFPGAAKPFCRAETSAPDIHGESGLDGTTVLPEPGTPERTDVAAVVAMYAALMAEPPKSAWLVATGCLTNVALLFSVYPELVDHIAGLTIMGGAVGGGFSDAPMGVVEGEGERFGNWSPWAEFNVYIDPESAEAVFRDPVLASKTTLVPLDLTHQMLATPGICQELLYGFDSKVDGTEASKLRVLFNQILTFFAKTYADVFGLTEGPPLHDPLAVAACFLPDIFNDNGGERFDIKVILDGEHGTNEIARTMSQCGRTVVTPVGPGKPGVRIPRSLDTMLLWRILDLCLKQAEGDNPEMMEMPKPWTAPAASQ